MKRELNRLEEMLKKKGIGPEGSKSLKKEELSELSFLFKDPDYSLTTKATLLTALLMLPASSEEKNWLEYLYKSYTEFIPEPIQFIIRQTDTKHVFQEYLCTTISGIDLSYEQAKNAMEVLLTDTSIPEYWKGAFLEAQRLKRESFSENKAFFDVLWNHTNRTQTKLPILIDICDNYDGFNRYHNLAIFFAATIASCGYPCIVHGIDNVAPKYGITSRELIENLKGKINRNVSKSIHNLQNPAIGWTYIDQMDFHPALYSLKNIRHEMVKRPFLATFEKIMQPIRAANGNYILTGYTHAHYRTEVAEQIKEQGKAKAAMVLKGLEGSSCPPLNRETVQVIYKDGEITDQLIRPSDFLHEAKDQLPLKDVTAEHTATMGKAALQGTKNEAYYQILYYASMVLSGFELEDKHTIINKVEQNLLSGKTYETFKNGIV